MLVHSGYFHIIFNILVQLALGIPLEMVHRWWRILLIYFCGVIAGSLITSITDPNVYLAGNSLNKFSFWLPCLLGKVNCSMTSKSRVESSLLTLLSVQSDCSRLY